MDLTENIIILRRIEERINNDSVSVGEIISTWFDEFTSRATTIEKQADQYFQEKDLVSAANYYMRASTYYRTAERFSNHLETNSLNIYNKSVVLFEKGLSLNSPMYPNCQSIQIPYLSQNNKYFLHAYYCKSNNQVERLPLIIGINGFLFIFYLFFFQIKIYFCQVMMETRKINFKNLN